MRFFGFLFNSPKKIPDRVSIQSLENLHFKIDFFRNSGFELIKFYANSLIPKVGEIYFKFSLKFLLFFGVSPKVFHSNFKLTSQKMDNSKLLLGQFSKRISGIEILTIQVKQLKFLFKYSECYTSYFKISRLNTTFSVVFCLFIEYQNCDSTICSIWNRKRTPISLKGLNFNRWVNW